MSSSVIVFLAACCGSLVANLLFWTLISIAYVIVLKRRDKALGG